MTSEEIRNIRVKHIQRLLASELVEPELKNTDCKFTHDAQMRRYNFYLK